MPPVGTKLIDCLIDAVEFVGAVPGKALATKSFETTRFLICALSRPRISYYSYQQKATVLSNCNICSGACHDSSSGIHPLSRL